MIVVYGIPTCESVKKARKQLEAAGVEYRWHDFRKDGLDMAMLAAWEPLLGWEVLLNRRGTSWRLLGEEARAAVVDAPSACAAMIANPTLVKRPVIDWGDGRVTVGYDASFERLIPH